MVQSWKIIVVVFFLSLNVPSLIIDRTADTAVGWSGLMADVEMTFII
jgi:hypothetical protein